MFSPGLSPEVYPSLPTHTKKWTEMYTQQYHFEIFGNYVLRSCLICVVVGLNLRPIPS